ncbi:hypothetical protein FOA52_007306 [Chlamydomonas sp. UWO 241]|nr:hypothetical protein FOA52_007306 [Chlamydomonas sp. UWO 241]
MSKRKALADEIADLLNPGAGGGEADPDAFGDDRAKAAATDDDQLDALDLDAQGAKYSRAKEAPRRRMRAAIDMDDDAEYRGKRSSRAAIFSEEEEEEEEEEVGGAGRGAGASSDDAEGEEEDEDEDDGGMGFGGEDDDDSDDDGGAGGAGDGDSDGDGGEGEDDEAGSPDEEELGAGGRELRRRVGEAGAAASRELADLEAEYGQLQAAEAETVLAMRARGEKERAKGRAVANQQHLYDRALEARILLQRSLTAAARLPHQPLTKKRVRGGPSSSDLSGVQAAAFALRTAALATLGQMVALQAALISRHEGATAAAGAQLAAAVAALAPRQRQSGGSDDEDDEEESAGPQSVDAAWEQLEALTNAASPFRDASLDRWHRRTVLMGAGSVKGAHTQLKALNQSVSAQVKASMRDPVKLIGRSRLPADGCPRPLGEPADEAAAAGASDGEDGTHAGANGSAGASASGRWVEQSYDDGEFYQQLLREFLSREGGPGGAGGAGDGRGAKRRKVVDRRASKGRKIRYHVQDKLVNFMASTTIEPPPFAAQLFANLFGTARAL